ncbi:MBL fold metallo-hydrolase OS=Streptomyces microflavus OX=1919 GN=HUT09_02435 PE=4 SV=1 [Streptomyces microflavus]
MIRGELPVPEPDLLDWERPLYEQTGSTVPEAPPTRVDREVAGGEVLPFGGGARVVHAPGHTPGSIALPIRRRHGVLFTGDCVASVEKVMLGVFNVDRAQARDTFRRLAALEARTVCSGTATRSPRMR